MRRIHPEIPVVMMSGFNEQEVATGAADDKSVGFLQKPFEFETLTAAIRRAIYKV